MVKMPGVQMKIGQQKLTHPSRVQSIRWMRYMTSVSMDMMQSQNAAAEMAMVEASQTQSVVTLKDALDADSQDIPTLTAIGYAVTSSQPGRSEAQKG